jgi:hypothetical protein
MFAGKLNANRHYVGLVVLRIAECDLMQQTD